MNYHSGSSIIRSIRTVTLRHCRSGR